MLKNSQKYRLITLIKQSFLIPGLAFTGFIIPFNSALANSKTVDTPAVVTENTNRNIYKASFFEQYLPHNAREMVDRLPGFSFDGGSNDRGFGGNAGNVLIDGARPTSKSGGLHAALVRIPADQVDRIEILRGGVGAGEASGQSVVANVIRKGEGTSGTWALKFRRAPAGETLPNVEAAVTTQLGDWNTSFDLDIGGGPGYRTAIIEVRDADDQLTSSSDEVLSDRGKWAFFSGQGSSEVADGLLTLNGRIGGDRYTSDTRRDIFDGRLPDITQFESFWELDEENRFKMVEVGIDWVKTNDDWKLHILGIGIVNDIGYENKFNFEDFDTNELYNSRYSNDIFKTELIARMTYGYAGKNKFKPEYGFELAQNEQSVEQYLLEDGIEIQLDGADRKVKELRSEIFASFVYPMNDKLTLEGGLTGEFSRVSVSDLTKKKNYQFLKPRLSSIYKIDKETRLIVDAERMVGQLAMGAFANSVDTADGNVSSGNARLAPDITDELSATYDWSFSERGSLKVKVFREWRKDILEDIKLFENITTGAYTSGIGNAGDARFYGVQTDVSLPLDWILKNGLIEINYGYRKSSFEDPVINGERNINGFIPNWFNFQLRQDITEHQFAWGVDFWSDFEESGYRVDERITFTGNNRFRVFVETSRFFGLKTQLEIHHINTGDYTRSRFFYADNDGDDATRADRGDAYNGSEVAYRHRKPEIKLSIWGTF